MYCLMCSARRRGIAAALLWAASLGVASAGGAQAPAREELLGIAREVVAGASFVSLATVDADGHPAVRAMDAIAPDENWVVWLATNPASRKVAHLRERPRVALHYLDAGGASYVTLIGQARLVDDPAVKARHWKESWTPFYPDRDESVLLIEVTPIRLEVVAAGRGAPGDPETWRAHIVEFPLASGARHRRDQFPQVGEVAQVQHLPRGVAVAPRPRESLVGRAPEGELGAVGSALSEPDL